MSTTQADLNRTYNSTTTFTPLSDKKQVRSLLVLAASTGTVTMYTLCVDSDDNESWETLDTYSPGDSANFYQGGNTFKFIPSDSATYFKYN